MSRLFILAGLIVIGVTALGFYFGYFRINSEKSDGAMHLTLTVEQQKIQDDEKKALEKLQRRE